MSASVEGKVARILSESHLIISAGSAAGVKTGMIFVVLAQGDEVKDPDTGETLGNWEVPKGTIRATHVQERLSTCEAYAPPKKDAKDSQSLVLSADMIAASMRSGAKQPKLKVNRADVVGMPTIGPISVGDKVRAVPQ